MKHALKSFLADQSGATAIEYGLIAAGISIAIVSAVPLIGTKLANKFTAISDGQQVGAAETRPLTTRRGKTRRPQKLNDQSNRLLRNAP